MPSIRATKEQLEEEAGSHQRMITGFFILGKILPNDQGIGAAPIGDLGEVEARFVAAGREVVCGR
ncbi:MAG: hypothetical protein AAGN35_07310 [Bacteroidota bacterium]